LSWNEGEIWEYIDDNKLAYPKLYDDGLSRIGCVICSFHSTANGVGHNFYRKRWPKFFERFEKKCREWYEKRQAQGREMFFDTPEEFISEWYKGNVQWYKRQESQTDQMNFEDFE
jgi:phosphoadenosine phosphosulfate reductase